MPLGWAWMFLLVIFVYFLYVVLFYYFYCVGGFALAFGRIKGFELVWKW